MNPQPPPQQLNPETLFGQALDELEEARTRLGYIEEFARFTSITADYARDQVVGWSDMFALVGVVTTQVRDQMVEIDTKIQVAIAETRKSKGEAR